jgi:hypothetical protein
MVYTLIDREYGRRVLFERAKTRLLSFSFVGRSDFKVFRLVAFPGSGFHEFFHGVYRDADALDTNID